MEPKLFPSSTRDFKKVKQPPLAPEMIYALLIALQKQERKIPFVPGGAKDPITTLIQRGLIARKRISVMGNTEYRWQVTKEAIAKLKKLGYNC